MRAHNWISHYPTEYGLRKSCEGVSAKISFPNHLKEGHLVFKKHEEEIELKNIHLALPLILFEQATRFLEDYLKNDTYYPVDYADQNLVRTKTQLKLFKEFNFNASLFN
jgi:hypothetical protein